MNRQKRVRKITYGIIVIIAGIALMALPKLPFIRSILSAVLIILGLIQFSEKSLKEALIYIVLGIATYLLYPYLAGSLYVIGLILFLIGLGLTAYGWMSAKAE